LVVFLALLVGTWFYLERLQKVSKRQQLIVSTVAFAIWTFSLGGPFADFAWYSPIYGAVLLPLYTFAVALVGGPNEPTS
jgi:Kef-type K+ transport system membrane component KefB